MTTINYKPLSVNQVWQGRRFKTAAYSQYEKSMILLLPSMRMPSPPYSIDIEFGMSKLSDIDNPLKPFLDILQKKYHINDRDINKLSVYKTVVKKGDEFIKFDIKQFKNK